MGATSVTGVGAGAAEPNRGPGNNRNNYVSLLDPHVVLTGTVYPNNGEETVTLPSNLKDVPEKLTCLVAGKGHAVDKNLDGDGLVESFTIYGAKKSILDYIVVKDPSSNFTSDMTD